MRMAEGRTTHNNRKILTPCQTIRKRQTLISMPVAVLDRMITTGRKAIEDGLSELKKRAS